MVQEISWEDYSAVLQVFKYILKPIVKTSQNDLQCIYIRYKDS